MNGYTGSGGVLDLYAQAMDSAGTAQEKFNLYQQGTQAQLDRLKASWEGMWMSAIKSNDMQMLIGGLNGLVTVIKAVTDHVGALPPLLALGGTALIAFNGGFKLITSTGTLVITILKDLPNLFRNVATSEEVAAQRTNLLSIAMKALTFSIDGLKTAGAFLVGALLPLAAFTAIGIGIEKVTQAISDYKQKQQEMQQSEEDLRTKYSASADQINQLASQYEKLDAQVQNGQLSKSSQDYVDTMNKLGSLMPSLVASTDEQGNKVLIAANATKDQLKYAQQLKDAYDKMNAGNLTADIQKQADQVDQLLQKIKEAKNVANNNTTQINAGDGNFVSVQKDANQQYQDTIQLAQSQKQLNDLLHSSASFITDRTNALNDMDHITQKLSSSQKDLVDSYIKDAVASKDSVTSGQDFKNFLDDTTKQATQLASILAILPNNISKVLSVDDISGLSKKQADALRQVGLAVQSGGNDLNKYKDILTKAKVPITDIAGVLVALNKTTQDATQAQIDYASEVQASTDAEMKKATAEEQIVGTTQNLVNQAKDLITTYQLLSNQENLSAEQKAALADATGRLTAMYPQFIQNGKLQVDQMRQEAEAEDILLKAVNDVANGHANAEEMMTLNMAMQSKNRLGMISDQIKAYQNLIDSVEAAAEADGGVMTGVRASAISHASDQIAQLKQQVDDLTNSYSGQIQHLANITGYQGQYYDSTTKSSTATQNAIYITDKYKQSMDALNAAISEYSSFQNKYAQDSASYRGVLQKEIDLLNQKEQLLKNQAIDLTHQINAGDIAQTGMINTGSSSSGGSAPSSSGKQYTGAYASYINEAAAKYGLDPLLVAAVITQESGFQPSVVSGAGAIGLMQLMPATAAGLGVTNPYDPYQNIMGGTKYLADQIKAFGGNVQYALAAYNAGPGAVQKYGGIPPYQETQDYVKSIDAIYAKLGGGNYATTLSTPTSSSGSGKSASQIAADKAQAIDQAKSDLLNLNQDLVSTRNQIEQLQAEIVQSKIDEVTNSYNTSISDLDQSIKNSQASMQNFVEYSAKWQFENDKQIYLQKQKIQINIDEENALKKLLSTMSLTQDQRAKLTDQIKQLDAATYQYKNDLYDLNFAYYTAQVDMFDKKVADLSNTIKTAQSTMSLYTDNMDVQKQQTLNIVDALNQQISTTQQEIKTIQYAISTNNISEQQKDQLRQKIQALTQSELDYANQVKQANDQLIQSYTTYYNNKAQLDKTALDNEYTAYQNEANKKLALIDKTNNDATYQSGLQDKQKAIKDLQNQINAFMLDPTQRGKVADLQKQMAQDQKDLSDYIKQHDIQNQKDAINADVTAKKNSIDQQKTQVDNYYNGLIQFQTAYLQTSEKMTTEHLDQAKGLMAKFASYIQNMFVNIGKSMDINMLNKFNNLLNAFNKVGGVNAKNPATAFWAMMQSAAGMKSFATGGYTGNDEGLAYLHSKEIILNKDDTANFLQAVDISRQFAGMMSKLSNATNLPAQNGVSINMPITIQSLNGTKEGANEFFSIVNSKLRSKGGLTLA